MNGREVSEIKDSGKRQEFDTGAKRDTQDGKGAFHLMTYEGLLGMARVLEDGAKKYDKRNWELGMPWSRYIDSALRHLLKHASGYEDEPHLGQAMFNIMAAATTIDRVHMGQLPEELDDRPTHMRKYNPPE